MKVSRFALLAGVVWGLGTLLIIALSKFGGEKTALVELDFRPLTATFLIAADGVGLGSYVSRLAEYAENGLPYGFVNVALACLLAFVDGFASGWLIAFIYNFLRERRGGSQVRAFAAASGLVLGLCSGLLAQVVITYGLRLGSFDYSVRPVSFVFLLLSKAGLSEYVSFLKDSYSTFPGSGSGVLLWAAWGFADGYIGGSVLCFLYERLRGARGRGPVQEPPPKT